MVPFTYYFYINLLRMYITKYTIASYGETAAIVSDSVSLHEAASF